MNPKTQVRILLALISFSLSEMSGVATKKIGGDLGIQLTFPDVFQDLYADAGPAPSFFSDARILVPEGVMGGRDHLQDFYHAQKTADAHRMALAKVQSTRAAEKRMLGSHQNYFGMPRPVLSQRFYANPSMGAAGIGGDLYSARVDVARGAGPMVGGVLRTAKGQRFGRQMLSDRVQQLSAIDAAKQQMLLESSIGAPPVPIVETAIEQGIPEAEGSALALELFSAVEEVRTAVSEGDVDSRITLSDTVKMLRLLFRYASSANREELESMKAAFDTMVQSIRAQRGNEPAGRAAAAAAVDRRRGATVKSLVEKAQQYISEMLGSVYLSPDDRRRLSRNLVSSLGFAKLMKGEQAAANVAAAEQGQAVRAIAEVPQALPVAAAERAAAIVQPGGAAQPAPLAARGRMRGRGRGGRVAFAARAPQVPLTSKFDRDTRAAFGDRQGAYGGDWNALPLPDGGVPARMGHRKPLDNQMPVREAPQMAPSFSDAAAGAHSQAPLNMTRGSLPTTREGYVELASKLSGMGHKVRVNKSSQLKSIRANFIKKFGL